MNIETEHKFLILMPDAEVLNGLDTSDIVQTYLQSDSGTERVRARTKGGVTTYTHTVKRRISKLSSEEDERVITRGEYETLLESRDHDRRTIEKTRTLLPHEGRVFEIDIYSFWQRVAVMEVEVEDEDAEFTIPDGITVIREVTGEKCFSNHALSRDIPDEEDLLKNIVD